MAILLKKLTETVAKNLSFPAEGDVIHWCPDTPGFGVRVYAGGIKSYVMERLVNGKTVRRTLGRAIGKSAISADAARKLQVTISSELQSGVDRVEVQKVEKKTSAQDSLTLAEAIKTYVDKKRRAKDGLPLSERTKADYLAMVEPGKMRATGEPFKDGLLYPLANKPLHKITAAQIKKLHNDLIAKRGVRSPAYAMQVLRAVFNGHGVNVPGSPFDRTTAGLDRIVIPQTKGNPKPIPPEKLGPWWNAANAMAGSESADCLRFALLTGARPGEVFGSARKTGSGLHVKDVDFDSQSLVLRNTKNRTDHTVYLSTQVLEILQRHCAGKRPNQKVFDVLDPGKTLESINRDAGTPGVTPHKLRHTFGSIADDLVSANAVKRMLNHGFASGEVTGTFYIGKSSNQLRAAWQTVADFIEQRAMEPAKVVRLPVRPKAKKKLAGQGK